MTKDIELALSPEQAAHPDKIKQASASELGIDIDRVSHVKLNKRSIDARSRKILVRLRVTVYIDEAYEKDESPFQLEYPSVGDKTPIVVVGSGPAGLFCALRLIELGYKPIVLERGKDVSERRKDLNLLNNKHIVNEDSNYCFGEGGAGTYSDGKLYTRSKKRGSLNRILNILVAHGATEDILVDSHPHIGTNKLPKIIKKMRKAIIEAGGEVHFDTRVTDFIIEDNNITGVVTQNGDKVLGQSTVLATGHSARDIFRLLDKKKIEIEAKPLAIGVRIEHPQRLIDSIQYRCGNDRGKYLPSAAYSLVNQVKGRGVYSFCMCPGGFIVPSATSPGEVVVNGMSTSTRDSRYANSGMVVAIELHDLGGFNQYGSLAAMEYQQAIERNMFELSGHTQSAPTQRMVDFTNNKVSNQLNACSYLPGTVSAPLHEALPIHIRERLQLGFKTFGKKMKGYFTNEAQILGVESRTSSPVKIPRDKLSLEHPQIKGLFPCGEGAGYAGGIISAAIDGERIAEAIVNQIAQ